MTTRGALEVVTMEPIDGSLWHRFRGSADVGLTLQPEVGQTTWTANGTLEYPAEQFRVDSQVSSYFDSQENTDSSVRQSFGLSYYQFLSSKWFVLGMSQFLKDNQLNLDLRSTFSGAAGRFLKHSSSNGVAIFAGIAATTEKYFDTTNNSNGTNAELLTGIELYHIRFASSQFKTKLLTYSGLSQWGRIRVDWESSISWEIFNNVYWKLSALENYDSRPPEGLSTTTSPSPPRLGCRFEGKAYTKDLSSNTESTGYDERSISFYPAWD